MAQGKTVSVTQVKNQVKTASGKKETVTVTATSVPTIVVDGGLVADPAVVDPGVVT